MSISDSGSREAKRTLITGGTGFIGSALARRFAAAGDEVMVLDRATDDLRRLGEYADRVQTANAELTEPESWRGVLADFRPQRVFHLAWYAEPGKYLTNAEQNLQHLHAGAAFVREVLALQPEQFVCAGTCFEYDTSGSEPLNEDTTLERPQHIYSASKLAFKNIALQLGRDAGIPLVWARVFYLYGPYEHPKRLVPMVRLKLEAGEPIALRSHGRQVRDYLHVDDVAAGFDAAAGLEGGGVVNIASGHGVTVRELTQRIARELGREDLLSFAPDDTPFDEPMVVVGDATRLRSLGWSPRHP